MSKSAELQNTTDLEFPRLSLEEIKEFITIGNYQINQSYGYIKEHFSKNGSVRLLISSQEFDDNRKIFCCRFSSRHKSQTEYKTYIQLKLSFSGHEKISGYYCNCKIGSRTVGCCSLIVAILVYFCNYKYVKETNSVNLISRIRNTRLKALEEDENKLKRHISFFSQTQIVNSSKKRVNEDQYDSGFSSTVSTYDVSTYSTVSTSDTSSINARSDSDSAIISLNQNHCGLLQQSWS